MYGVIVIFADKILKIVLQFIKDCVKMRITVRDCQISLEYSIQYRAEIDCY